MRVGIIPADLDQPARFEDVKIITLEDLQKWTGDGLVEVIETEAVPHIQPELTIWLNEEGKVLSPPLPTNRLASLVARVGRGIRLDDRIHGDIVITGPTDSKGYSTGLNDAQEHWFMHMIEVRAHIIQHNRVEARAYTAALS